MKSWNESLAINDLMRKYWAPHEREEETMNAIAKKNGRTRQVVLQERVVSNSDNLDRMTETVALVQLRAALNAAIKQREALNALARTHLTTSDKGILTKTIGRLNAEIRGIERKSKSRRAVHPDRPRKVPLFDRTSDGSEPVSNR